MLRQFSCLAVLDQDDGLLGRLLLLCLRLEHLLALHEQLLHFALLLLLELQLALKLFLLQLLEFEQLLSLLLLALRTLGLLALLLFGRSLGRLLLFLCQFRGLFGCLLLGSLRLLFFTLFVELGESHALHLVLGFLFSLLLSLLSLVRFSEGRLKCLPLLLLFVLLLLFLGCRSFGHFTALLLLGLLLGSSLLCTLCLQLLAHLLLSSSLLCLLDLALLFDESFSGLAGDLLLLGEFCFGLRLGSALLRFELLSLMHGLGLQSLLLFSFAASTLLSSLELLGLHLRTVLRLGQLMQTSRPFLLFFLGFLLGCLGFRLLLRFDTGLLRRLFLLLALSVLFLQFRSHLSLEFLLLLLGLLLCLALLLLLSQHLLLLFLLLFLFLCLRLGSFLVGFLFALLRLNFFCLLADLLGSLSLLSDGSSDLLLSLSQLASAA